VLGRRAWELGEQAEAGQRTLSALATLRGFRDSIGVADMVEQLAWITAAAGDHERAGRPLGAARALRGDAGIAIAAGDRHREYHVRCTAQVQDALGPAGYERALTAGAALDGADRAIAYALDTEADAETGAGTGRGAGTRRGTGTVTGAAPAVSPAAESGLTRREEQVVALGAR
jgi:non-specific serine/threonine protein kinase